LADCPDDEMSVNHAVTLVGYGVDKDSGLKYWLIKNSWGTEWGDAGYFKIERDVNMCAIGVCNSYPQDLRDVVNQPTGGSGRA